MCRLFAALMLCLLATTLHAETYEAWEKSVPNPAPLPFKGWLPAGTTTTSTAVGDYSVFNAPEGRLFGHLDLSSYPTTDFPLRVRFLYYNIGPAAINPAPNGKKNGLRDWTAPLGYLAPDAALGDLLMQRDVEITSAADATAVPVWATFSTAVRYNSADPFYACSVLVEVAGHDGTLLSRKNLIEAVVSSSGTTISLARAHAGAEDYAKTLGDFTTTDDLPVEPEVYESVKVLWLDETTLHDPRYTDTFWRRVFFARTMVAGHAPQVQELAQRLGLTPDESFLPGGGLWSVDNPATKFEDLFSATSQGAYYDLKLKESDNPFRNPLDFGRKKTSELRRFSIWFLVSFTVFEFAIILGSMFYLSGPRRVLRWLLIPLSAMVYTALGLAVVNLVVDFRPEAQIFQEVDSMEGWPECLVRTDLMRLGFAEERTTFSAPAPADFSWAGFDPNSCPLISGPGEVGKGTLQVSALQRSTSTIFSMRQRYGRFANAHIRSWAPGRSPLQMTSDRKLVEATRPLRAAWLWDGRVWRDLGPMTPGQSVTVAEAPVVIDPAGINGEGAPMIDVHDTPGDFYQEHFSDAISQTCNTGFMKILKGTDVGILLAIDAAPFQDTVVEADASETHTQTLLVHRFMLPPVQVQIITSHP